MRRVDQVASLIVLLIASVYLFEASRLPVWKDTTFGSGLFPLILGVVLVLVSIASLLKATAAPPGGRALEIVLPRGISIRNLAYVLGALAAYVVALEYLGFLVVTFLFLLGLFVAFEPKKKLWGLVLALVITLCCYVVFRLVFTTQLPRGLLG